MPDSPVPVAASPGDPPRRIGYRTLYRLLPGNLQIVVVALPLVTITCVLWFTLRPNHNAGKALFVAAAVFPVYVVTIESFRRKLRRYRPVAATVTAITAGDTMVGFGGCKVLRYRYDYEGRSFKDEHMTVDPKGLTVGAPVWVLVDPKRPSRSVLWVGM
jgi:hypothetical protein